MATAHLIHGYIGSGKTTLAKRLEADHRAIRFTIDEWVVRLYGANEGDVPPGGFDKVKETMATVWPRALELGIDVVLDFGFWSRQERDDVRLVVRNLGAQVRLYQVTCDDETAWRRVERRNENLGGTSIEMSRNTFEELEEKVEPLGEDEARIVITSG